MQLVLIILYPLALLLRLLASRAALATGSARQLPIRSRRTLSVRRRRREAALRAADVCYARSDEEARQTNYEWWPNAAIRGDLGQELPLPEHFEQAASMVTEADVAERVVCGPDPDLHRSKIQEFADAGFDHVYVHQVGPDQEHFFAFYQREILRPGS